MSAYILYGTSHCHLCELAIAIVQPILAVNEGSTFTTVDIASDEALYLRYGMYIPILEHSTTGRCLYWPFDAEAVHDFLQCRK